MKNFKKLIAVLMVIALMIPCTAMAATESPSKTKIEASDVTLSETSYTYDGTAKKPTVTVKVGDKTLEENTDYVVTYSEDSSINAGEYTVKVEGKGVYEGSIDTSYTIEKATQSKVKVNKKKSTVKTVKAKTLKKKSKKYTLKLSGVKENAKVTVKSKSKKLTVSYNKKTGKITVKVKKGTNKGKYKFTVTLKSTDNYKKITKTFYIKVK